MGTGGSVYILSNKSNKVLYVGATSELYDRIKKHREKFYRNSFTARYNCNKLVYYKNFTYIEEAIAREKQLKAGSRSKKLELIRSINPEFNDLWEEIKEW